MERPPGEIPRGPFLVGIASDKGGQVFPARYRIIRQMASIPSRRFALPPMSWVNIPPGPRRLLRDNR